MASRALHRTALALGCVALLSACNEQRVSQGFQEDQSPPLVQIVKTQGDTLQVSDGIVFSVSAADNLGLRKVSVTMTGGFTAQIDSVFTSAVTSTTLPIKIPLPANTTAGGVIVITATAIDGSDNTAIAVDSLFLVNKDALTVRTIRPSANAVTSPGLSILIEVSAEQPTGVRLVGYTITGVVTDSNSTGFSPLVDSATFVDTLAIAASTAEGTFEVQGFADDSAGRRATSSPLTVTVQSITQDQDPPIVSFTIGNRVEVRDSITVRATDPSGIQQVGWLAIDLADGATVGSGTTVIGGGLTEATEQYNLNFSFTTFPQSVEIQAFAVDGAGNRGEARIDTALTAPIRRDTVLVVNGITKKLPLGGRVADAVYNRNLNEVYLTNVELNRVEIFQVADTSFDPNGIPVGARPWGIALWPSSTNGTNADMIMVANSGGTNISVVDVAARQELRRHALPNFIIQFVQTEVDPANGLIKIKIDEFDFSDRPEFLAATCIPQAGVGSACFADSIYAVYSTTPTIDQGIFYRERGTVRWENLTSPAPQSHFFWEQAEIPPSTVSDTLQILIDRGPGIALETSVSAACGVTVDRRQIAFAESTFVRNSGDFTHAIVGEGGIIEPSIGFARAIGYSSLGGIVRANCAALVQGVPFAGPIERDQGISTAFRVRDFISNTAIPVRSVGINFNGLTNLIRADSIYVLDEALRLTGSFAAEGANPGMDLNFDHRFDARQGGTPGTDGGALDPNDRLVFVARGDPIIDIVDTWFYRRIASIPIRDPIIGPLRAARLASGDQVIIGVTARGVVTVRFPAGFVTNPFPSKWDPGNQ